MKFFKHLKWALKYGVWSGGCEFYKNKPMFGFFSTYYDGYYASLHLGPLWIGVEY